MPRLSIKLVKFPFLIINFWRYWWFFLTFFSLFFLPFLSFPISIPKQKTPFTQIYLFANGVSKICLTVSGNFGSSVSYCYFFTSIVICLLFVIWDSKNCKWESIQFIFFFFYISDHPKAFLLKMGKSKNAVTYFRIMKSDEFSFDG